MKSQFLVTIEGKWLCNGKPATSVDAKRMVREALKEEFNFLANKVTVVNSAVGSPVKQQEGK